MLHDDGYELVPVARLWQLMKDTPHIIVKYGAHNVHEIQMCPGDRYILINTLTGWRREVSGRARLETFDPTVYKWGNR